MCSTDGKPTPGRVRLIYPLFVLCFDLTWKYLLQQQGQPDNDYLFSLAHSKACVTVSVNALRTVSQNNFSYGKSITGLQIYS